MVQVNGKTKASCPTQYSWGIIQVSQSAIVSSCLDLASRTDKIEPKLTFFSDQIFLQFQKKLSHYEDNAEKNLGVQDNFFLKGLSSTVLAVN